MIPASTLGLGLKQPEMAAAAFLLNAVLLREVECRRLASEKADHGLSADTKGMEPA